MRLPDRVRPEPGGPASGEAGPVLGSGSPGRRRARRWGVGALAAALFGAVVVLLVQAPVPATSGPSGAALTGPESVPHSHIAVAGSGGPVPVGGLSSTVGGYTLVVTGTSPFAFHVQGPDGAPVTRYALVHEKPLHLIVVRRDLSGFQHVHPSLVPDGTWTVPLALPAPGPYRVFADFTALDAAGRQNAVVLGADVPPSTPVAPAPSAPASASPAGPSVPTGPSTVDGLTVSSEGALRVGVAEPLLFRVTRAGVPVAVQPYLGAYGHLTMLRETDLAYLHIHPEPGLADGAAKFWVAAPSAGTFRMFLDYQVDGAVHTAQFTVAVS